MIPTNYYGSPTYNTFDASPFICHQNNCSELVVSDNSYWATYLFKNIQEVVIEIGKTGSTPVQVDITSDIIRTATGTVTTDGTTSVVGSGTSFTTEFRVGDYILIDDTNQVIEIESIQSDTALTLSTWADAQAGSSIHLSFVYSTITASDLGVATIDDGIYDVNYYITVSDGAGSDDTFTYEEKHLFACGVECCVNTKIKNIAQYYDCSNCDDEYIQEALTVKALFESMKKAAEFGDMVSAEVELNKLIDICAYEECQCN